ncbi:hypothetical protein SAMD00019534_098450 [Acytostelium subglobosum LB1]|uniref:hypothetical protein n=1 Tax=Acytostelium subglobosum LB1 TaxID=1410327 RepID=UPI0006451B74|nr:hypothetical protein SAMD00019534_098450 [Acytostelium subglobosum LB1]GAM26670.1 hypothetical protein SAMD00019534_098450 [Acytostelium subglobosum LB1]|eukprot:XP_012750331.1 hypothetical protein SAMD00019534_098450 [Acytostelium subglobosum LB1]
MLNTSSRSFARLVKSGNQLLQHRYARPSNKMAITTTTSTSTLKSISTTGQHITNITKSSLSLSIYINNNGRNNYSTATTQSDSSEVLRKLITPEQKILFEKNTTLLEALEKDLLYFNAPEDSRQLIKDAIEQLKDQQFLLVVVGEFNSGKSSFLNALLGNTFLKEGITPTTSKINILKYGDAVHCAAGRSNEEEVIKLPVPWLHDISLVDTPGTNAVVKGHQQITEHFIPRSDMVLFVTSVDRAFSESERSFLANIRAWRKKIVVVLSKADLIEHNPMSDAAADLAEVTKFVQENFNNLLGVSPVLFPVSSKLALKAKLTVAKEVPPQQEDFGEHLAQNSMWRASKFAALERYILHTLDSSQRAKLKLLNPLGVSENILHSFTADLAERAKVLTVDQKIMQNVEEQLDAFRKELHKDLEFHLQRIDNNLLKMETRADAFLDDNIRLTNALALLRTQEMKLRFEKEVVGNTMNEIEANISTLIDWIVEKNAKQWHNIMDYIDSRSSSRLERLIGNVNRNGDFLHTRSMLLQNIGESTSKALSVYNKENEATKITQEIRDTLFRTAAIEVGAVGLGTILTASLLDVSGIIGMGVLAIGGLGLLPLKKSALKKSVHSKVRDLRHELSTIMNHHFETELEHGIQKMKDGISPFSNYIIAENDKLNQSHIKLQKYNETISNLKEEIELLK